MYKYVKIVLTFPAHIKTTGGGWYSCLHTAGAKEHIKAFLNINKNYFVSAETYQNCK